MAFRIAMGKFGALDGRRAAAGAGAGGGNAAATILPKILHFLVSPIHEKHIWFSRNLLILLAPSRSQVRISARESRRQVRLG